MQEILKIRKKHPKLGTRKLLLKLQNEIILHNIRIGRDALFDLLRSEHLLIRNRVRRARTTNSYHRFHKYPNLIKDFTPTQPNQLYVSDITYWWIGDRFVYISLITDAYSHKIVGWNVSDSLETVGSLEALQKALSDLVERVREPFELLHHSDRGVQYCDKKYVKLLQDYDIKISMTESGDPRENAIAERVNGIIKNEYLKGIKVETLEDAKRILSQTIDLYNNDRPHSSISYLTPNEVHKNNIKVERKWKNYYKKSNSFAIEIVNPI
jgi:transposase InsO family protein